MTCYVYSRWTLVGTSVTSLMICLHNENLDVICCFLWAEFMISSPPPHYALLLSLFAPWILVIGAMCAVSYFGFEVHDVHTLCPRSLFGNGGIQSMFPPWFSESLSIPHSKLVSLLSVL